MCFRGPYHDLLGFGKVVDWVGVQFQNAELVKWCVLLGYNLGRIQDVKAKGESVFLVNDLGAELPLWPVSGLDGLPEILPMVVRVLASKDLGLLPYQARLALARLEVPFDELRVTVIRDKAESMHSEAVLDLVNLIFCKVPCLDDIPCDGNCEEYHSQPWPRTACARWTSAG